MKSKLRFGVFKTDCYKMNKRKMEGMFLESFDDYGDALEFARGYSNNTAIHLTYLIK